MDYSEEYFLNPHVSRLNISTKVMIFSALLIFTTATLVGGVYYFGNKSVMVGQQMQGARNFSHTLIQLTNNDFTRFLELSDTIFKDKEIIKFQHPEDDYFEKSLLIKWRNYFKATPELEGIILKSDAREVHIRSTPDKQLYINDDDEGFDFPTIRGITTTGVRLDRSEGRVIEPQRPVVWFGNEIDHNGQRTTVWLKFELKSLFNKIQSRRPKNHEIFLTTERGDYLFSSIPRNTFGFEYDSKYFINMDFPQINGFFENPEVEMTIERIEQQPNTGLLYRKFMIEHGDKPVLSLAMAVQKNYSPTIAEFQKIRRRTFITASGLILMGIILSVFFSRVITKNLNKVTEYALDYSRGKKDIDIEIEGDDEIGILATTFKGMIRQVNERTRRIKRSEERAREAFKLAEEARVEAENQYRQKSILLEDIKRHKEEIEKISAEKDNLMAIVSHDLKNPLSVIGTSMDIIMDNDMVIDSEAKDLIARSRRSAKYSVALITDLLDLARLEGGIKLDYGRFHVQEMVDDAIQAHLTAAQAKNITIKKNIISDIDLNGDRNRLEQVLNNLIGNAIKFTPENGEIIVTVKNISVPTKRVIISVKDNGRGIPGEKLDSVFEKFNQAEQEDRKIGTGLGLAICRNICELHQGSISVESEEGQGSTFIINIPDVEGGISHIHQDREEILFNGKGWDVAIADDQEDNIVLLEKILSKFNFTIRTYSNGLELIDGIDRIPPKLIFLDLDMPVLGGLETLRKIKADPDHHDIPIVIYTAKVQKDELEELKRHSAGIILKPFQMEELVLKLNNIFADKKDNGVLPSSDRILFVDDSEDSHALFSHLIRKEGIDVDYCFDGDEAVSLHQKHLHSIVLMDINMPGADGYKATRLIRAYEQKNHIQPSRIYAITASSDPITKERVIKAGCDAPLGKPLSKEKLAAVFSMVKKKAA